MPPEFPFIKPEQYKRLSARGVKSEFGKTYEDFLHVLEKKVAPFRPMNFRFLPIDFTKLDQVKKPCFLTLIEMIQFLDHTLPSMQLEFVFRYKKYDGSRDTEIVMDRLASREAIRLRQGTVIEQSIQLIEAARLDSDGTLVLR